MVFTNNLKGHYHLIYTSAKRYDLDLNLQQRKILKDKNKCWSTKLIMKTITKAWKSMTKAQKLDYEKLSKSDRERYEQEKAPSKKKRGMKQEESKEESFDVSQVNTD